MQVGSACTGNTFNVSQISRSFRDEVVILSKDTNSLQAPITDEAVTRRALITLLSGTLPLVALLADVLGIFGALHLDYTWFLPGYFGLVVILTLSNADHLGIFWRRKEIRTKDTYVDGGKIAHFNSNGTFTLYKRTARCRYPKCKGFIEIVTPPPKEKQRCFLAGRCTLCGTLHSYRVDPNWVAYPDELNWSEDTPSR